MTKAICPRCGQPTVEVKTMPSGRLFVHSVTVENGMPVQDACRVSRDELTNGLKWTQKG